MIGLNVGVGCEKGDQYVFNFFGVKIKLPYRQSQDVECEIWLSWGFTYCERGLHFDWEKYTKIFYMPWDRGSNVWNKVLSFEGKWIDDCGRDYDNGDRITFNDDRRVGRYPYTYRLTNGKVQNVYATIYVEKRIWWWRVFHFLPFIFNSIVPFKTISKSISVDFSSEVGERSGSWKGGTLGCGYRMKKNETPYQCLRRMEIEREF